MLIEMAKRPRRNRATASIRSLVRETRLTVHDFVVPLFLLPGANRKKGVEGMPYICGMTLDLLLKEAEALHKSGVAGIGIFPYIPPSLKTPEGEEAGNPKGPVPTAIATIKRELPALCVIADIALDPYTSHGHDGILSDTCYVDNDKTLEALAIQSIVCARAGADLLAPSDMMDGRVGYIRKTLDREGFTQTGILSYCVKYASSLYAPFRGAIGASPLTRDGDKMTYQMDPANVREAVKEALSDEEEGADMLMIKPALPYLDIISEVKKRTSLPIGAYHVSGEYGMVMAAHERGWLDAQKVFYELLTGIKRAGAGFIFTYSLNQVLDLIN